MLHPAGNNIKYTAVLQSESVADLKNLVSENVISSVSQGIRIAVETYVIGKKKIFIIMTALKKHKNHR